MAKPWTIVTDNLTGYDLEDLEHPQRRELQCPSCEKTGIFTEKELVKNLKMFGVSVVAVEDTRRVYQCPFCQSAVEPPPDVALAPDDPRVAALKRRMAKAREDIDVWTRRAELASRAGDDVLASEARAVAEQNRELVAKYQSEIAALTSTDGTPATSGASEALLHGSKSSFAKREEVSIDRDFAALKAKFGSKGTTPVATAEAIRTEATQATSDIRAAAGTPGDSATTEPTDTSTDADEELARLKAKLAGKPYVKAPSPVPAAQAVTGEEVNQSRDDLSWFRPRADEPMSEANEYVPAAVDYAPATLADPTDVTASTAKHQLKPTEPAAPEPEDDDPVAALKRKLKKP
jgi:hypothetical protein